MTYPANGNPQQLPDSFRQFDINPQNDRIDEGEITEGFVRAFSDATEKDRESVLKNMLSDSRQSLISSLIKFKQPCVLATPEILSNLDEKYKKELLASYINLYECAKNFPSQKTSADAMFTLFNEEIAKINSANILNKTMFTKDDFLALQDLSKIKFYYDDIKKFYAKNNIEIKKIPALENLKSAELEDKIFACAVSIIKQMPCNGENRVRSSIINVLTFITETIPPSGSVPGAKSRKPCEWHARKILAEGNFYGCTEIATLFQELLAAVLPDIKTKYVSSFYLDWAIYCKERKPDFAVKDAPGHAVVEVADPEENKTFLVDPGGFGGLMHSV